jgi:hypothetical protein
MQAAIESGPNAVAKLPSPTLYMWLSKIFYGVLYREFLLLADRRNGKRRVVPKELLRELRVHHDFMQEIRLALEFPLGIPGSIFIFGTTKPNRVEEQFDFLDNHGNRSIALRMGSVGVVCIFQDGGLTKLFHDRIKQPYYRKNRLHPIQFREVTAQIFYKSMLLDSTSLYFYPEKGNEAVRVLTLNPGEVNFRKWDLFTFCKMLAHYWGQPVDELYGGDRWASSLRDDQNKFRGLDPDTLYRFSLPSNWRVLPSSGA